jgi:hypothetical protein
MRVEMRPAIPSALPHVPRARRERLLRWVAAAVTMFAATVAVLGAAMTAVMLGITWSRADVKADRWPVASQSRSWPGVATVTGEAVPLDRKVTLRPPSDW